MSVKNSPVVLCLVLALTAAAGLLAAAQTQPSGASATKEPPPAGDSKQSPASDSEERLRGLIQSSGGSEEMIILNLEEYLREYPRSARRVEIEEQIYRLAVKVRDRDRTISYAEKQAARQPAEIDILTTLVSTLRARRAGGDLARALLYADQLVTEFEKLVGEATKPGRLSRAQWQDQKEQGLASIYLVRGRVLADLARAEAGRPADKSIVTRALTDLRRSLELAPLAGAALALSELAEDQQRSQEALDYALQAFVIGLAGGEEVDLKSIRQRLTRLHAAVTKRVTENGLGDLVLQTWDRYTADRERQLAKIEATSPNSGLTDPLLFKLTTPDGSILDLASLRGKVVVMNFWATWCGPCRTELPLFQKTIEKYRSDSGVAFLAVSTDEDREFVKPYLEQNKHQLPVVFAEKLDELFNVTAIPTTIIINREGKVAFRLRGFNPNDDFVAFLSGRIEAARK